MTATRAHTGYRRWDLSAWAWSGAEYGEEGIKIIRDEDGTLSGCTEADQCVRRDLDDEQLASVIREFKLDV